MSKYVEGVLEKGKTEKDRYLDAINLQVEAINSVGGMGLDVGNLPVYDEMGRVVGRGSGARPPVRRRRRLGQEVSGIEMQNE